MIREQELGGAPSASTWLTVDAVSEAGAMARMRAEWDALLDQSNAGIFNSWEWLYPWVRRIGTDRQIVLLTARDRDGRLVGLMPLGLERRRVLGRTVRRLAFLGETHVGSDYLDVIAPRGLEEQVARAFVQRIRDAHRAWDVLDLTDFDEASITPRLLAEAFGDEVVRVTPRYVCPYQTLTAEQFDDFLRRTGRRDNYLRRRKWLEKQPGFRIEKTESPGALARPMAEFLRLHAMRWSGDGGSQGIKGPSVEGFHRDATQLLAERGLLRMYTLKLGEQALASVYGIIHRGKFIYFQSGYDPEWRSKSVGLVLVGETFKDSLEQGLTEYDFLRGTESYKADWTSQTRNTVSVRVHAHTGAGAWFSRAEEGARQVREITKKLLPTETVESIRRLRRKKAAI